MEDSEVQAQPIRRPDPVAGLVGDHALAGEGVVPENLREDGQGGVEGRGQGQVALDAGRRAHGPGDGGPHRLTRARRPEQAATGLELEARILVPLQLGPQTERQAILYERDLVLDEDAENVIGAVRGDERDGFDALAPAGREPIPKTPDHLLVSAEVELVLGVDIERVASLPEAGLHSTRAVVVGGDGETGPQQQAIPSSQQIASRELRGAVHRPRVRGLVGTQLGLLAGPA